MEKQYRVFAGSYQYPLGGMEDLKFTGTYTECALFLAKTVHDWFQIVDENFQVVEEY